MHATIRASRTDGPRGELSGSRLRVGMLITGLVGLAASACSADQASPPALDPESTSGIAEARSEASFSDLYRLVAEVTPEQNAQALIARVRDVELLPDGGFLVLDDSEGNGKLYAPDGSLRGVIGRRGEGPGEFRRAAHADVDARGRIHVADPAMNRVQVFDASGSLVRITNVRDFSDIRGFAILNDTSYLFLAGTLRAADEAAGTTGQEVLFRTDTLAEIRGAHLPIRRILPPGQDEDPAWDFARNFFLDVRGDTAFVIASVTNVLWRVVFPDGDVTATEVRFGSYDAPRLPPATQQIKTAEQMMDWFLDRHLSGFVRVTDEAVLLPFIQGWMMRGDPVTLLHQSGAGDWHVVRDAPIIVAAKGNRVVAVEDPATDAMRLLVFERRPGAR